MPTRLALLVPPAMLVVLRPDEQVVREHAQPLYSVGPGDWPRFVFNKAPKPLFKAVALNNVIKPVTAQCAPKNAQTCCPWATSDDF